MSVKYGWGCGERGRQCIQSLVPGSRRDLGQTEQSHREKCKTLNRKFLNQVPQSLVMEVGLGIREMWHSDNHGVH